MHVHNPVRVAYRPHVPRPTRPDPREVAALAIVFGTNAVVHRVLPHATHVPANLLAAGGVLALAATDGVDLRGLGLAPEDAGTGARTGALVGGALAATIAIAAATPAARGYFTDARVTDVGRARALYELLVRIPIGTALAEELLFRSGLTGLLARRRSWTVAMAASSAVFGLWHVLPTVDSLDSHPAGDRLQQRRAHAAGGVAGVVATTALAGAALGLLQRRTRHVIAPVIVHAVLNGSTYAATRFVARS
jgi:membrane protease YdiL (CAAX protease family)